MGVRHVAEKILYNFKICNQTHIPSQYQYLNPTHILSHSRNSSSHVKHVVPANERVLLHGLHDLPVDPEGILEIREYTAQPAAAKAVIELYARTAAMRRRLSPFLGMFTADTGGSLTTIIHLYQYRGYEHRAQMRAAMAVDEVWQRDAVDAARVMLRTQSSKVIRHSEVLHRAAEVGSAASFVPCAAAPIALSGTTSADSEGSLWISSGPRQSAQPAPTEAAVAKSVYIMLKHNTGLHPLGWHPIPSTIGQAQAHGAQLVFAGLTELGVRSEAVELLRFDSVAALDACFEANWLRSQSLDPAEVVMLQPVPASPWQ